MFLQNESKNLTPHTLSSENLSKEDSNINSVQNLERSFPLREEKYEWLFKNTFIAIYHATIDGKLIRVSPSLAKMFGYDSPEEMMAKVTHIAEGIYANPDERRNYTKILVEQGFVENYELECNDKNKKSIWVLVNAHIINDSEFNVQYYEASMINITDRKNTEMLLRQNEAILRATLDSTTDGILVVDNFEKVVNYNSRFAKIWKIPKEILDTRDDKKILDYAIAQITDPESFISRIKQLYADQENNSFDTFYLKDGRIIERYSRPQKLNNKSIGRVWSFRDVTERRKIEEDLIKSEERYRNLIDQSTDGVLVANSEGYYVDVNIGICKMLGYKREELLSMHMKDLSHKDDLDKQADTINRLFKGESVISERRLKRKDGSYVLTELNAKIISDGRLCAYVRDVTERKKAEEEHLKLLNLESLGVLAGGFAHDFNNILTAIMLPASILEDVVDENNKKFAAKIIQLSKRASELTRQLLTFARGTKPFKRITQMRNIIQELIINTHFDIGFEPKVDIRDTYKVNVDSEQITVALQKILVNAIDSMPEGGAVEISTEDLIIDNKPFVRIKIKDHGIGIPKKNLSKIFNPYFTTKHRDSEKGIGLGLSISYSIIDKHNGKISIDSELGMGTTVTILFSAVDN